MSGVASSITLKDKASAIANKITQAVNRTNRALETTNRVSNQADPGRGFRKASEQVQKATQEVNGFNRKQDEAAKKARKVSDGWSQVKSMVRAAAALMGAKMAMDATDTYTSNAARLGLINDGLRTQAQLQKEIYGAAQRSRGSYNDMVSTVSKLGLLAGESFANNDETVRFAELMQKSFAVSGASAQEQSAAMYQLTQAMAAGKLQGDEFRSIMENAPMLADAIAEFTGRSKADLKQMSADGEITAEIIKGALFSAGDDIEAKFAEMPMTFASTWTQITNYATMAFSGAMERLNAFLNSDTGQQFVANIMLAIDAAAEALVWLVEKIALFANFVVNNLSWIAPIVYGIVAAFLAYKVATLIAAAAQVLFNGALWASPITWIVLAIAAVVTAIALWAKSVGGFRTLWLIVVNGILTAWDTVKIGFFSGVYWILDLWARLKLGIVSIAISIQNAVGDFKAGVLMLLQNLVNGAIDIINGFIGLLNKIPGVEIGLVEQVTFGTEAQLKNEAEKQARNAGLENYRQKIEGEIQGRENEINRMYTEAYNNRGQRQMEIARSRAESMAASEETTVPQHTWETVPDMDMTSKIGSVGEVGEVDKVNGDVNITSEDLKYLRDLAEQEIINRFTTAEIRVDMVNNNSVSSELDLDGITDHLRTRLEQEMYAAAEGVHV